MEENKNENKKLSYEQLEAYAQQTTMQAEKIFKENQMLKQSLERTTMYANFKEIDCALKCLDHADMFSAEFISNVVKRLEEVLSPAREESQEDNTDKIEDSTKEKE